MLLMCKWCRGIVKNVAEVHIYFLVSWLTNHPWVSNNKLFHKKHYIKFDEMALVCCLYFEATTSLILPLGGAKDSCYFGMMT